MSTRAAAVRAGLAVAFVATATTHAAVITFAGPAPQSGTGFGNVLNVLTLQNPESESGSVLWNGTTDVLTGNATPTSQTRTAAQLAAAGITSTSTLGVVFNLNETGSNPSLTVQGFTVRFLSPTGATLFDAVATGSQTLTALNPGTGGSGFLWNITLTPTEQATFFSNPANRIGIIVSPNSPITGTDGGPDNFYLIPSPGAATVLAMAAALGARRRRR